MDLIITNNTFNRFLTIYISPYYSPISDPIMFNNTQLRVQSVFPNALAPTRLRSWFPSGLFAFRHDVRPAPHSAYAAPHEPLVNLIWQPHKCYKRLPRAFHIKAPHSWTLARQPPIHPHTRLRGRFCQRSGRVLVSGHPRRYCHCCCPFHLYRWPGFGLERKMRPQTLRWPACRVWLPPLPHCLQTILHRLQQAFHPLAILSLFIVLRMSSIFIIYILLGNIYLKSFW